MYNTRSICQNNNRSCFIPFIIGGLIGYGIANNQRQNYWCHPMPINQIPPHCFCYPMYRKR